MADMEAAIAAVQTQVQATTAVTAAAASLIADWVAYAASQAPNPAQAEALMAQAAALKAATDALQAAVDANPAPMTSARVLEIGASAPQG